jgi:hypothetical protein
MMNAMCGTDRWGGLTALGSHFTTFPGAVPQAGMEWAVGPYTEDWPVFDWDFILWNGPLAHTNPRQRGKPFQRGSKALDWSPPTAN